MNQAEAPQSCPCGRLLIQPTTGRRRHYCSEECRRTADTQRKAERTKFRKASQCRICGGAIGQVPIGRPVQRVCHAARLKTRAKGLWGYLRKGRRLWPKGARP